LGGAVRFVLGQSISASARDGVGGTIQRFPTCEENEVASEKPLNQT
jgi:hypothetical protein